MFLRDLSDYSIQSLRIFTYVASMGSVAEAAEALGLSQPAVSLQISNLEKHLGFSLFERSGRKNVLTARGQDLYQKLLPMLERLELLLIDAREEEHLSRPKLYLGSVEGIGEYWLLNRFNGFRKDHPEVRLFLEVADNPVLEQHLATGRVDIIITTKKVDHPNVISELLMDEVLVPVGRKEAIDHLARTLENAKPGERFWEQISWIGYGDSYNSETWAVRWLEQLGTTIDRRFRYRHQANSYAVLRRLVSDGVGVCVAPKHSVEDALEEGTLHALESKRYPGLKNRLYLAYREQSLSRSASEFRDWILPVAAEYSKDI